MARIGFKPGVKALSPDSEVVEYGVYAATTLSAVDSDLATGNIKDGITIFGVLGTLSATLAQDILGYALCALGGSDGATTSNRRQINVAGESDSDLVAKTQAYDASSMAVAVANLAVYWVESNNTIKLRVYMGGVQAAESAYLNVCPLIAVVLGTRALSGDTECKAALHNYNVAAKDIRILTKGGSGTPIIATIAIGSIKLT